MTEPTTTDTAPDAATAATESEFERAGAELRGEQPPPQPSTGGAPPQSAADLTSDDVAALEGLAEKAEAAGQDTVKIGDVTVPISALNEVLADAEVAKRLKRKVKANGEELEVSLADAFDSVPLAKGAQKRMWEAAQVRKQAENLVGALRDDPVTAFEKLFGASDGLYDAVLKRLEYEGLPPEQRAKMDEERELRRKAQLADEYEKQRTEEQRKAEVARLHDEYAAGMRSAFESVGVPLTAHGQQRAAMLLSSAMQEGLIRGNPTPEDYRRAAEHVQRELTAERESFLPTDADGDALIEAIGEDRARLIARAMASRVRKRQAAAPVAPPVGGRKPAPRQQRESWETFFERKNREMGVGR